MSDDEPLPIYTSTKRRRNPWTGPRAVLALCVLVVIAVALLVWAIV